MIATTVNINPFPGLRPFNEDETHLFFGREAQVDELVRKLGRNRFLAVIGTSGSGKSSLVNCGLFPALHRGNLTRAGSTWHIAKFRPGNDPIQEMALALSREKVLFPFDKVGKLPLSSIVLTNLLRSKLGLIETYKQARLGAQHNLLIVVDQFEELFRFQKLRKDNAFGNEDRATAFINLLLEAARQTQYPIYVAITMRSDFLGDCAVFNGLPEMINRGQYLVPRMKREERKSAIAGPIEVAGGKLTDRLLIRLVNDVGDNPDQLSILQHALNRTWAAWEQEDDPQKPLDLDHYQKIGTMSAALDQHAERAYHELPDERARLVCSKLFKALTDVGMDSRGVRRPTKLGMLSKIIEASPEELEAVIDVFRKPSRSFLMPPAGTELREDTIIDISHESFMRIWKRLIKWTKEEQESVRIYSRLSESAVLHKTGKTTLLTDPYLQFALSWLEQEKPNEAWASRYNKRFEEVTDYLRKSRREQQLQEAERIAAEKAERKAIEEEQKRKARRAKRNMFISFGVSFIGFIVFLIVLKLYLDAEESKNIAESAEREADSLKVEILNRLGFSDENVHVEDVGTIFAMKDLQDSIRMMENGNIPSNDASLISGYQDLLSYEKFLKPDTIASINRKISVIEAYDRAQALSDSDNDTITLNQLAAIWQQADGFHRKTPKHEQAHNKSLELQEQLQISANISGLDSIRFLTEELERERLNTPPASQDTLKVGGGRPIHVWVNASDPNGQGLYMAMYTDGERVRYSKKELDRFPMWRTQQLARSQIGKSVEVRIFNKADYLIARKPITLLE
jgi:energy-coupling factor transporter ATP-binding protein EcfA2